MPSIRLVDGDLAILWNKLAEFHKILMSDRNDHMKHMDAMTQNSDIFRDIQKEIRVNGLSQVKLGVQVASICSAGRSVSLSDNAVGLHKRHMARPARSSPVVPHVTGNAWFDCTAPATSFAQGGSISQNMNTIRNDMTSLSESNSAASESDVDFGTGLPFTKVISRAKVRVLKRKEISPLNDNNTTVSRDVFPPNKRATINRGSPNNATVSEAYNITGSITRAYYSGCRKITRITGQSQVQLKVKAATVNRESQSVFCISNIEMDSNVADMKSHLR